MKQIKLKENTATILLAMIICARASSFMFSKQCLDTMNSFSLISIRFIFASLLIFIFFSKKIISNFSKTACLCGCLFGILYTCVLFCELTGLKTTPTGTAAFLENMAIIFVPLIESLIFRKKAGFRSWCCGLLALLGIGIISFSKNGFSLSKGQCFLLLAALFYSSAIITTDKLSKKGNAFVMGFFQILTTGIVSLLITIFSGKLILPSSPSQFIMIGVLTVVCTCFGFTFQPVVQSKLPAQKVALFCALGPFTAVILGAVFLKENLTLNSLLGEGCIMVSLIVSSFGKINKE